MLARFLVLLLAALSAQAAPKPAAKPGKPKATVLKEKSDMPALLQEVEAHYAKSPTLVAKFSQSILSSATGVTKKSSGLLMFKRPNKFRWEILQPDASISVSNGVKAWHYTPPFDEGDQGHVIVRRASQAQTRLASALLSGSFSGIRGMKVQPLGDKSFVLVPKAGTAGEVKRATIEIDPATKLIKRVTLDESAGNKSAIDLSNVEIGKTLPDALFNFKAPPGTTRDEE